ncbi:DUF3492 domain-containing protein [Streptomyces tsukubensis]|uniref:DUF3492 domain-containing protein n=1 Tax=Streptomyces tsukubensis TaxID=83656 RepID=UPI00098F90C4|nr:DUF3492 domain-containing protein [Streptomyces tsukubensis]QFR95606.1 DUF3492 domain-containing protein [Streptomyces tsukubensis]
MRIGLLTEGGYPYASGEARLWCDRLVRGLDGHEFDLYALSRSECQEAHGWVELPPQVSRVRTAPLWAAPDEEARLSRRGRRRFAAHYGELAATLCSMDGAGVGWGGERAEDRFSNSLHGLAELAADEEGLSSALRSEAAVRALESACRAPGARRAVRGARVADLVAMSALLEEALRPLSLDWYAADSLGAVDLCHATSGGSAALPGLLARHFSGVPLLVTEYGVRLRAHYLGNGAYDGTATPGAGGLRAPVRAVLAAFHRELAAEVYRRAVLITPGNTHARRWQEQCGAERAKLRTVYPGMDAARFARVGDEAEAGFRGVRAASAPRDPHSSTTSAARSAASGPAVTDAGPGAPGRSAEPTWVTGGPGAPAGSAGTASADLAAPPAAQARTLVWVGRAEPTKDLVTLLHAVALLREDEPETRLRVVSAPTRDDEEAAYLGQCRALAEELFTPEHAQERAVSRREPAVAFEEIGDPGLPDLAEVYAAGNVVVLSSLVEGFPISLVEAMFCGCATVSTDVGAVVEVIGGTGLVVEPADPSALAAACRTLLRDPERRARLGAAARARALELFTIEQNVDRFREIYQEIVARCPVERETHDAPGEPLPFARPAERRLASRTSAAGTGEPPLGARPFNDDRATTPSWARTTRPHTRATGVSVEAGR